MTAGNISDAVKIYQRVLQQTDSAIRSYDYSRFQEMIEGIALYTEYKIAELAAQSGFQTTPEFRRLATFKSYRQLWEETYKNKVFLIKFGGRIARSRNAFYPLGLGKGLLLDRLMPDWKTHYFEENVWLDDLLTKALSKQR
jgi:hypothetical protein